MVVMWYHASLAMLMTIQYLLIGPLEVDLECGGYVISAF